MPVRFAAYSVTQFGPSPCPPLRRPRTSSRQSRRTRRIDPAQPYITSGRLSSLKPRQTGWPSTRHEAPGRPLAPRIRDRTFVRQRQLIAAAFGSGLQPNAKVSPILRMP